MSLSYIFISCGFACVAAGWIMSLAEGRKISSGWLFSLAILFVFAAPFFAYAHWNSAKRPFAVIVVGVAFLTIGILLGS